MSDAIDAMRKAQEERFFKLEQEKHLMAYIKKLKAEGRYDSIPAPVARDLSSSALPQVMAHSLRLSQPTVDTHMRRELDRSFLSRHVVKGVCTGDPYLISSMTMGSRVSLGKSKWSAGTVASGVENTTIFSVHKAPELMAAAPKHVNGVESRAARHMVDNSFVEIAGKKVKLGIDPRSNAPAWGGTLAIWGTAALTVGTCKILDIKNMDDLRVVMNRVLTPIGEEIKAAVIPVKAWLAPAGNAGGLNTADSNFARGIRHVD